MYKDVVIIQKEEHKDLKVGTVDSMAYSNEVSHVPVTVGEFFYLCKSQPILFVNSGDHVASVSLLGLQQNVNLFLDKKNNWIQEEYCPAFLRQYPFVFAQTGENFSVAYDRTCKAVNTKKGEPIYNENGEPTQVAQNIVDVLTRYQNDMKVTQLFIEKVKELELFEPFEGEVRIGENGYKFEAFLKISEEKFNALSEEIKLELIRKGFYNFIIAHLISLSNFDKLIALSTKK